VIGAAVFVVALVCAQEAEEPGQPRIPEEETAPPLSPTDELEPHPLDLVLEDELPPCGPRSEQLYREGFALLAKNDRAEAVRRFNEVLRTCPEHPYAAELRRLAAFYPPEPPRLAPVASNVLVKKSAIPSTLETTRPQVRTRASLLARAELITVQSANGLVAGFNRGPHRNEARLNGESRCLAAAS
jgi:hypothetical protein